MKLMTFVLSVSESSRIVELWKALRDLRQDVYPIMGATGNAVIQRDLYLEVAKEALAKLAKYETEKPLEPLIDPMGEHFYETPIGFWVNNLDLFKATKIYRTRAELEAKEGTLRTREEAFQHFAANHKD